MEDLLSSKPSELDQNDDEEENDENKTGENNKSQVVTAKKPDMSIESSENQMLNKNDYIVSQLVLNYKRWRYFLITWKRLELLKLDWGRRKLGVENINTPDLFSTYSYINLLIILLLK